MRSSTLVLLLCFFSFCAFSQKNVSFHNRDISITIKPINDFERIEISTSKDKRIQILDTIERSITEKKTYLDIADYNFDGFKDFSCSHVDDGMGVYTVYQIFIYDPKTNLFNELRIPYGVYPNCEGFCDIKLDKKRRRLLSSCRGGARWHEDVWTFDKNGKLKLKSSHVY